MHFRLILLSPHKAHHPPKPGLGFCLQPAGRAPGELGDHQPSHRCRRHGEQQSVSGGQLAASTPLDCTSLGSNPL
jgi:hypothetical protein